MWGRPEDMHMSRPSYFVDSSRGGSDVAGETVAALVSGSMAFKDRGMANAFIGFNKSPCTIFVSNVLHLISQIE